MIEMSFLSCHALLTENKVSVNRTGLGFMVWGKALLLLAIEEYEISYYGFLQKVKLNYNISVILSDHERII